MRDARLQKSFDCLIAASVYHSAGNMMSGRDTRVRPQPPASGVLSFGRRAAKIAARERPTSNNRSLMTAHAREEPRSEEHTSELQSLRHLVCRLLLEKKN